MATATISPAGPTPIQPSVTRIPGFQALSPYWQAEFRAIQESNESYRGHWNWCAFFFTWIWALTKGLWLSFLISLVVGSVTFGLGWVVYWFIYASRGNYMYYSAFVKNKQLAA